MSEPSTPSLRPVRADDLPSLYRVGAATGSAGSDASGDYDDPNLIGHIWAAPHAVADAELCTVVTSSGEVAGYLVATSNTVAFEDWCERAWWPQLRERYALEAARRASDARLVRSIHRPDRTPSSITDRYPAHLHINLLPELQGEGWGRVLIERLIEQLRSRDVAGLHLGVDAANTRAIGFYTHLGFAPVAAEADGGLIMARSLR